MRKKLTYTFLIAFVLLFIAMNYVAYNHAYNFTHYANIKEDSLKVRDADNLGFQQKLKYVFLGVDVPRPVNTTHPSFIYTTNYIQTPKGKMEIWEHNHESSRGTIVMFHGYDNKKSSLIKRANHFIDLGFSVILVDFLGSGGSDGNYVTVGYEEAEQVNYCFEYAQLKDEKNIYLFGISMGAVSIMKCQKDHHLPVTGIILECPFGKMRKTLKNRFNAYGVPSFPMVDLLMLWGSYHSGYWTYSHNPQEYAKYIDCPALLMHGNWDPGVSKKEIDDIYNNLKGEKTLKRFLCTGHDVFISKNYTEWKESVADFLIKTDPLKKDPVSPFYMDENEKTGYDNEENNYQDINNNRDPVIKRGNSQDL